MVTVIAGKYKGHKLKQVKSDSVRPTSGRVKKSMFQILEPITGKRVLDLYAGIGSLGIEALSRGAEKVTLVEKSKMIFKTLQENTSHICNGDDYDVFCIDSALFLKRDTNYYDIIIADPPYENNNFFTLKELIKPHLFQDGVFCMEMKKCPILDYGVDVRNYGNTQVAFWRAEV